MTHWFVPYTDMMGTNDNFDCSFTGMKVINDTFGLACIDMMGNNVTLFCSLH